MRHFIFWFLWRLYQRNSTVVSETDCHKIHQYSTMTQRHEQGETHRVLFTLIWEWKKYLVAHKNWVTRYLFTWLTSWAGLSSQSQLSNWLNMNGNRRRPYILTWKQMFSFVKACITRPVIWWKQLSMQYFFIHISECYLYVVHSLYIMWPCYLCSTFMYGLYNVTNFLLSLVVTTCVIRLMCPSVSPTYLFCCSDCMLGNSSLFCVILDGGEAEIVIKDKLFKFAPSYRIPSPFLSAWLREKRHCALETHVFWSLRWLTKIYKNSIRAHCCIK